MKHFQTNTHKFPIVCTTHAEIKMEEDAFELKYFLISSNKDWAVLSQRQSVWEETSSGPMSSSTLFKLQPACKQGDDYVSLRLLFSAVHVLLTTKAKGNLWSLFEGNGIFSLVLCVHECGGLHKQK